MVTVVWVGYDDNRPIKDKNGIELSSGIAIPIWVDFMKNALTGERDRDFPIPEGIIFAYIDAKTGEIVRQDYPNAQQVALKVGTELPVKDLTKIQETTSTVSDSLENLFEQSHQDSLSALR